MRIGDGEAKNQTTYVGNAAWAHVCALRTLVNPETRKSIAGQPFFITDNTPVINTFDFLRPFILSRGYDYPPFRIPFKLIYYLMSAYQLFLWLLGPIVEIKMEPTRQALLYIDQEHSFSRQKAKQLMGYEPKYTYDEALSRSISYYDTLVPHKDGREELQTVVINFQCTFL
jgi:3beta-hydroxy-delta5-steroid dehydrogenase / steroid delta-isomerase